MRGRLRHRSAQGGISVQPAQRAGAGLKARWGGCARGSEQPRTCCTCLGLALTARKIHLRGMGVALELHKVALELGWAALERAESSKQLWAGRIVLMRGGAEQGGMLRCALCIVVEPGPCTTKQARTNTHTHKHAQTHTTHAQARMHACAPTLHPPTLPAPPTRFIFPTRMWVSSSFLPAFMAAAAATASNFSVISTVTAKMECEREESWFIIVAPVLRFFLPTCRGAWGSSMGVSVGGDGVGAWERGGPGASWLRARCGPLLARLRVDGSHPNGGHLRGADPIRLRQGGHDAMRAGRGWCGGHAHALRRSLPQPKQAVP